MLRINGWPLYILGSSIGLILDRLNNQATTPSDLKATLSGSKPSVEAFLALPFISHDLRILGNAVLANMTPLIEQPACEDVLAKKAALNYSILQFNTMMASNLFWFDLYWIQPKLGFNTTALLTDATIIFPETIRSAIPPKLKYEVQMAAACLLLEVPSALGFHVLRAVEIAVIDYFTIPGIDRGDANNWAGYTKVLRHHGVHRKIVAMVDRLATLHRNELMHAEAVLTVEEAAILFALMQEVLPVMIADVARRKGAPIANFTIFDDPRWQ